MNFPFGWEESFGNCFSFLRKGGLEGKRRTKKVPREKGLKGGGLARSLRWTSLRLHVLN